MNDPKKDQQGLFWLIKNILILALLPFIVILLFMKADSTGQSLPGLIILITLIYIPVSFIYLLYRIWCIKSTLIYKIVLLFASGILYIFMYFISILLAMGLAVSLS